MGRFMAIWILINYLKGLKSGNNLKIEMEINKEGMPRVRVRAASCLYIPTQKRDLKWFINSIYRLLERRLNGRYY